MKRIAILAIAALAQPVHRHYIATYWTELIRHTNAHLPHVDVYLLNEHGRPKQAFAHIADNVIDDPRSDLDELVSPRFQTHHVPGILSKTIHALDVLAGRYDVYFRTNLSSMIKLAVFDRLVQSSDDLCYSGGPVWTDALRADLLARDRVGPGRSVRDMSELDEYPGNTFVSGSGYLLNAAEAEHLVGHRDRLRYDLPDDVAVGLMLDRALVIRGFTTTIKPELTIAEMLERMAETSAAHIRLQHLPVERAQALWRFLARNDTWR